MQIRLERLIDAKDIEPDYIVDVDGKVIVVNSVSRGRESFELLGVHPDSTSTRQTKITVPVGSQVLVVADDQMTIEIVGKGLAGQDMYGWTAALGDATLNAPTADDEVLAADPLTSRPRTDSGES
jgi:hypothetical protein